MPLISMFYGIIVRMQNEVGIKHNLPHIHCEYAGNEIVVDFDGNVLDGSFPIKQLNILKGWIAIHKDELDANWKLLSNGEKFFRIDKLNDMLRPKVIKVKPLPNYILYIMFDNGAEKDFDVKPYIKGDWYGELKNVSYFNKVFANGYTVVWPNGQDLCPDEIYEG